MEKNNMIISEKISEKYRKYIVCIKFSNKNHYILWGTSNIDDEDYFALNEANQIMYGKKINEIKGYLYNNISGQIDSKNLSLWLEKHLSIRSYTTFNLDIVRTILEKQNFSLSDCSISELNILLSFRNLFSDYIYQINSSKYKKLIRNRVQSKFYTFVYANCFWKDDYSNKALKKDFNNEKFVKEFLGCLDFFVSMFVLAI